MAVFGLLLLAAAAWFSGSQALGQSPECPPLEPAPEAGAAPPPQVYLTGAEIKLGAPLCLALDRARFFAPERVALAKQQAEVTAAEAALTAAGATPAAAAAQTRVNQARAALATLPRERKVFILLDEVKVPMEGRSVSLEPAAGGSEWTLEEIGLRGTEDASGEAGTAWRGILGGPKGGGIRAVRIGVAVEQSAGQPPVMRALVEKRATLRVFDVGWVVTGGLGLILLAVGIGMAGWNTGLLRAGKDKSPFSLARVQMAWWLVLTLGGFLFIWLVSGQWKGVMTTGVIALLGISATTGVAAQMVGKDDTPPAKPPESDGFLRDIMTDPDGAALHRIQLVAWTIVLGGIFVWTVIWTFSFPDFDPNLLLLAGIAGGTYLGFKFQERKAS